AAVGAGSIGAGVALGEIQNTVRALVDGSPLGAGVAPVADVTVSATSTAAVTSTAFAGAIGVARSAANSGSALAFGLAASVAVNTIDNTVEALVQGTTQVWSSGAVSVSATDDS